MRYETDGEYTTGYDDNGNERERFITPSNEPQLAVKEPLTRLQFLNRFTDVELAAIYTLAKTNVQIEIMLDKFKAAEFIATDDPQTVYGINALEAAGLIATGRAAEILA